MPGLENEDNNLNFTKANINRDSIKLSLVGNSPKEDDDGFFKKQVFNSGQSKFKTHNFSEKEVNEEIDGIFVKSEIIQNDNENIDDGNFKENENIETQNQENKIEESQIENIKNDNDKVKGNDEKTDDRDVNQVRKRIFEKKISLEFDEFFKIFFIGI